MEQHITPKLLREYAQRIAIQPPGAQDPQDWHEMTNLFARAFDHSAAEIERLTAEVAVRDRALEYAVEDQLILHERLYGKDAKGRGTLKLYMDQGRNHAGLGIRAQEAADAS
jgi:hypothetical protein